MGVSRPSCPFFLLPRAASLIYLKLCALVDTITAVMLMVGMMLVSAFFRHQKVQCAVNKNLFLFKRYCYKFGIRNMHGIMFFDEVVSWSGLKRAIETFRHLVNPDSNI
jgi:hypothetical protein